MKSILFVLSVLPLFLFGQSREITLDEIWTKRTFSSKSVRGVRSMNDGAHYTSLVNVGKGKAVVKYAYKTGSAVDTLVKSMDLNTSEGKPFSIQDYSFSADETQLMLATDVEYIYRHSTRETNYVYSLKKKTLKKLSEGQKQRYATFSPSGNKAAFVRENNLIIRDLSTESELSVTTDGAVNSIINGATDWVYEEEFSFDKAFFWSPDGKKIAFYRFDESQVPEFNMPKFGELYPKDYRFKYPKCGEANSKVSIHIYDIAKNKTIDVLPPVGTGTDGGFEYIPRIKWTKDADWLSIQRMNRHQNKLDFMLANAASGEVNVLFTESNETYIDITDNLTFLDDKKRFIWTSEKDGYNHIYLYSIAGKQLKQITMGNWDVSAFLGVDEKAKQLYYTSSESSPINRELYSISLDGEGKKKLSAHTGTNSSKFSKGMKFYINYFSDANTPSYITLHDAKGTQIRVLQDNASLKDTLGMYKIGEKEFFDLTTSEGVKLNGWMMKPADFQEDKKYPVMMYVYGGPGAQTVKNSWGGSNHMWYHMLTQKGYIVVSVDNRGTGARGEEFKKCTYKQLGKLETVDQIEAGKWVQKQSWADPNRIGIWGWSYGGYMSSLCITKGADVFKMAMAVAPVTNWRYYDSIYTERYMQTPKENANGYDDNSPINHVDKLKGKYLLVHGSADDNVHFQNSVEMVSALNKAGKQFDFAMYPNHNHSIYGGNARFHLFTKMTDFIEENL